MTQMPGTKSLDGWLDEKLTDPKIAGAYVTEALTEDPTMSPIERQEFARHALTRIARIHGINIAETFPGLHVDSRDNHPGQGGPG